VTDRQWMNFWLLLQLKCRLDRIERRMSLCSQKQQTGDAGAQTQATENVTSASNKFVGSICL